MKLSTKKWNRINNVDENAMKIRPNEINTIKASNTAKLYPDAVKSFTYRINILPIRMLGYSKVILMNSLMLPIFLLSEHMARSQADIKYSSSRTGIHGPLGSQTTGIKHLATLWCRLHPVAPIFEIIKSYHHSGKNRFILYFDDGFACDRDNFYGFNWYAHAKRI